MGNSFVFIVNREEFLVEYETYQSISVCLTKLLTVIPYLKLFNINQFHNKANRLDNNSHT